VRENATFKITEILDFHYGSLFKLKGNLFVHDTEYHKIFENNCPEKADVTAVKAGHISITSVSSIFYSDTESQRYLAKIL
jgi:broad specificity polyphosphatase/5'/3'-nucleotidase SurE